MLEARVDHARVVGILRKADHLPLIKDYLLAVQKANLAAVNEAINELLIEEDDFSGLRESITTYDNYDQVTCPACPLAWHTTHHLTDGAAPMHRLSLTLSQSIWVVSLDTQRLT